MLNLQQCRQEIDRIDDEILKLFQERIKISYDVADNKIATGKKVYDRERENEKIEKLTKLCEDHFHQQAVQELFSQIMSISRRFQYAYMEDKISHTDNVGLNPVDILNTDQCKVVFQGVNGSYSQMAMLEYFGDKIDSYHVECFADVMEELDKGKADYGILPIENSSTGIISEIYDLLIKYDNYIVGEQIIKIEHSLLGTQNAIIDKINRVCSHPQGLMQCAKYLEVHSEWEQISVQNTAMAAKKLVTDSDDTQAAIASIKAAEIYGLKVLCESINCSEINSTRFIVISKQKIYLKEAKKISMCFELPHKSGTLYNILSNFIYNNLNMTKIESRPLEDKNWEYRFFVDIEGNINDAGIQNALKGVMEEALNFKLLGNY